MAAESVYQGRGCVNGRKFTSAILEAGIQYPQAKKDAEGNWFWYGLDGQVYNIVLAEDREFITVALCVEIIGSRGGRFKPPAVQTIFNAVQSHHLVGVCHKFILDFRLTPRAVAWVQLGLCQLYKESHTCVSFDTAAAASKAVYDIVPTVAPVLGGSAKVTKHVENDKEHHCRVTVNILVQGTV